MVIVVFFAFEKDKRDLTNKDSRMSPSKSACQRVCVINHDGPLVQIDSIPQESSIVVLLVFLVAHTFPNKNFPHPKKTNLWSFGLEFNTYIVVLDHPNFRPLKKKRGDMLSLGILIRYKLLGFWEVWYKCRSTSPSYFVLSTLKISGPPTPKRKKSSIKVCMMLGHRALSNENEIKEKKQMYLWKLLLPAKRMATLQRS